MKLESLYQKVTDQIIAELEQGAAPWTKPWKQGRKTGVMPVNHATNRSYSGINVLVLWAERELRGFEQSHWLTFKQALDLGGHVRKGETSTTVVYANKVRIEDGDEEKLIPFLKAYSVFNVQQCEGLKASEPEPELPDHERDERAERFFAATGAVTRFGESMAAYIPARDQIVMPARGSFKDASGLYATWAHECVHWSGAKSRLNRELSGRWKTESYAAEELIAELGAAFLAAELGIVGELRHAGYIESWLKLLKGDNRAVFTAAAHAQRAANFLKAFSEPVAEAA